VDLKEAARKLGISETTARRWIKTGRLEARVVDGPYGPQYEIDEEAVEAAKNFDKMPVVISGSTGTLPQEVLVKTIQVAAREAVSRELLELKNEVEGIRMQLVNRVERLAAWQEERDRKLLEAIREIQKRQEEMSQPFWKRWFKKG
jgi:excisionase family DNA binding protein